MNIWKKLKQKIKTWYVGDVKHTDYSRYTISNAISNAISDRIPMDNIFGRREMDLFWMDEVIKEENIPLEYRDEIINYIFSEPINGRWEFERSNIIKNKTKNIINKLKKQQPIQFDDFLTEEEMII